MAKKYVIYLDSRYPGTVGHNSYGYWSGKTYTVNGEIFPVHSRDSITCDTKKYTSYKRALQGAEALLEKCAYVWKCQIEEIGDEQFERK